MPSSPLIYGSTHQPNLDWLYHYTDCKTAIQHIVGGQKCLRLNNFENVNDPREGRFGSSAFYGQVDPDDPTEMFEDVIGFLRKRIKVLCFSVSDQRRLSPKAAHPDTVRGHLKPRMWASYGQNHKGVCLVFSKPKIDELISKRFPNQQDRFSGLMKYSAPVQTIHGWAWQMESMPFGQKFLVSKIETGKQIDVRSHVAENIESIGFRKDEDWQSENEYRYLVIGKTEDPEYVDISDAIHGIVLGTDCMEEDVFSLVGAGELLGVPVVQIYLDSSHYRQRDLNSYARNLGTE